MKQFAGFPAKMQFTALPSLFFSTLLPQISDIAELKITIHILATLLRKRGYPRFVTCGELLANRSLMRGLKQETKQPEEILHQALAMSAKRGTILQLTLDKDGVSEDVYFLNAASDRQAISKIRSGELALAGREVKRQAYTAPEEPPDIFTIYEENIGMLTPMVAEELKEAERLYPAAWLRDAIKEAVNQSKRSWSYISAILERWSSEGKSDGTYQRDSKKTDPDKYIKGRYGHMVRR